MTLRQIILLQACRETLDRAKRTAWWWHRATTAGTEDAHATARATYDQTRAAVDGMLRLIRAIVETAWREVADDAAIDRFLARFTRTVNGMTTADVMARGMRRLAGTRSPTAAPPGDP
jgi:hypothetical protein